jgi:hypothetical protein
MTLACGGQWPVSIQMRLRIGGPALRPQMGQIARNKHQYRESGFVLVPPLYQPVHSAANGTPSQNSRL